MSLKAAPHELADRPVLGTPRVPPFIMLCIASASRCGRYWIANTVSEYDEKTVERDAHHLLCAAARQYDLILPKGTP